MTRLELLDKWFLVVPHGVQRVTLIQLYQAGSAAVKDAMIAAMKVDLNRTLQPQSDQAQVINQELEAEIADINTTL